MNFVDNYIKLVDEFQWQMNISVKAEFQSQINFEKMI